MVEVNIQACQVSFSSPPPFGIFWEIYMTQAWSHWFTGSQSDTKQGKISQAELFLKSVNQFSPKHIGEDRSKNSLDVDVVFLFQNILKDFFKVKSQPDEIQGKDFVLGKARATLVECMPVQSGKRADFGNHLFEIDLNQVCIFR